MNLLLTGATGLIGRHVLRSLPSSHAVRSLVRPASRAIAPGDPVFADLGDPNFTSCLPESIDAVIHLAQSRNFRAFPDSALEVSQVNLHSTIQLAHWAREVGATHFIYASSGGVYGTSHRAFTEDDSIPPPGPLDYYLGTKLSSELLLAPFRNHLNIVILRFFFVYGPGQDRSMLIPRLISRVVEGEPVDLSSETGIRLNPIHARDAAAAIAKSLDLSGSATINVAGSETVSIRQLCDLIGEIVGREPRYRIAAEDSEAKDLVAENARMISELHAPTIDLKTGLRDMTDPSSAAGTL